MLMLLALTNSCKKDVATSRMDPLITWVNPSDISFGALLNATQLNASANVPGNFVYTPSIGTQLNVGLNQDLKVEFIPNDSVNYNSTDKIIKINVISDTVTDADGNVYHVVTIGTQIWMVENLRTTKYKDGITIPLVTEVSAWDALTTPAYCAYNNTTNADTINTNGLLYNWYSVKTNRLCPTSWHVPTNVEWAILEYYLYVHGYNYDGTTNGYKYAKALASNTGWYPSANEGAVGNTDYPSKRNATDFTALPSGYRGLGLFYAFGYSGHWWSSSENSTNYAVAEHLYYSYIYVSEEIGSKSCGFSVRCVRD